MKSIITILFCLFIFSCNSFNKPDYDISLIPVKSDSYWGYINETGKYVINPQYIEAYYFSDGLAMVKDKNGKYGFIDKSGDFVIKPQYVYASVFSEGLACVTEENSYPEYINNKGEIQFIVKNAEAVLPFSEGLACVKIDNKYGFINKQGNIVINPQFSGYSFFKDGLAAVTVKKGIMEGNPKDVYGFIDKNGKYVVNPQFDWASNFSEGLAVIKSGDKYGYIDESGKIVINPQFESSRDFSEGLASVTINGNIGFIDKTGVIQINPQFLPNTLQTSFNNSFAQVTTAQKVGYIDKKGVYIINPQFLVGDNFNGDYAIVRDDDNKVGLIDKTGKYMVTPQFDDAITDSWQRALSTIGVNSDYVDISKLMDNLNTFLNQQQFLKSDKFSVNDIQINCPHAVSVNRYEINYYKQVNLDPTTNSSSENIPVTNPVLNIEVVHFNFNNSNPIYNGGADSIFQELNRIPSINLTANISNAIIGIEYISQTQNYDRVTSFAKIIATLIAKKTGGVAKLSQGDLKCARCLDDLPSYEIDGKYNFEVTTNLQHIYITRKFDNE